MDGRLDSPDGEAARLAAALGSQYEVVRLIGQGGMGRVYLAREPFLDRQVAVKVLPAEIADTGDARERFLREARTAARLSHPNIVPLYTFGQAGTLLFFVMGYVQGESLETRLAREGRMDPEDARQIIAELADAFDYAHRAGVVHRDVKPDNVLIDAATGRAMLADFGIAKQSAGRATLTQTGMIMGTPHYMSPEQAAGDRALDGRSDLYSLGVLAYRMLAGRLPFEGESVQEVLTQHLTRAPQALEVIVPDLPLELSSAVSRALAKDPQERWASGRAMRESLTGDSEESMPDEMRTIVDGGVRMIGLAAAVSAAGYLLGIYGFMNPFGCVVIAATGIAAPIAAYAGTRPIRRKLGVRAYMSAWLRQPKSWGGWWPRFGRRAGDVWDRLPEQIRSFRVATSVASVMYVPFIGWMLYVLRPSRLITLPTWFGLAPIAALVPMMVFIISRGARQNKWARAQGLAKMDAARTLTEPSHARSFWSRPEIARLLLPAQPARKLPAQSFGSAPTILRDLSALAAEHASSPFADLYRDAAGAARIANAEITACDAELARLATDTDPRERARIQASLDALGEPTADDRTGKQEVRALLIRQLGMFNEMERRQTEVSERRQRVLEHLRMLGLQVAQLRDQAAESPDGAADITGRIRSLCRGADARIEGLAIVDTILETS